ncbi:ectonucleotide pyrophosphatase/phosphodiesterase family member 3 [Parasteatoda tepidariorum]|uniref:ectonucleotide pyrophosphatase/phosphodiesterase family member 3 n=1 Tax=Parasteatoda tepidariorum TaxID=114398 RepID=UPI0039BD3F37
MELVDKKIDRYEVIEGNTDPPWHKKYRKIVWIVIALVGIAILTTIIVISLKCQNCNSIPTAPTTTQILTDSPSLHWEEECSSEVSVCPASFQDNPPLLLVSLDGLRVDYLKYGVSPTLSKIAECGVKAEFMYPIYPSKTFPNHYTIVTGLYPESHGVIDNQMYDLAMNKRFKVGKTRLDDPRWWQKEPIWVTAQKQGKSAACFFWPGSDVRINGSYPNFYFNYNGSIPFETRVDQILEWLMLPKRPDFLTLYFDQPDKAGHAHGPDSFEVKEGIKTVDGLMNRLLTGLEIRNLTNCVNIIIVSDHGMSDTSCDRIFDIRKYINISTADVYTGSFGRIRPKEDSNTVDEIISQLQCQDSHLRVYRKEELPVRMHYVDNAIC